MSNPYSQGESHHPQMILPAFTAVNHQPRAEFARSDSAYTPNPAFRPPHREPVRPSIFDIPEADDAPPKPAANKRKRTGKSAILTTPLSLSQTTTPPDSRKQARKTSAPGRPRSTKSFPDTGVSKPNFHQHRMHSYNDKSQSQSQSLLPSSSSISSTGTTMQNGIAMTTMQKLAAFRYQPSSTGSVHKAVLCCSETPRRSSPDHARIGDGKQAGTTPNTVVPSAEVVEAVGNSNDEHFQGTLYQKTYTMENSLGGISDVANAAYPLSDSALQASEYLNLTARSVDNTSNPATVHLYDTKTSDVNGGSDMLSGPFSDNMSHSLESAEMMSQNFYASMHSSAASLSTAQSAAYTSDLRSAYDDGLEDSYLPTGAPSENHNREHMSIWATTEPGATTLMQQGSIDQDDYLIHEATGPDEDMLDYGAFRDLTADPWNHMDYIPNYNPIGNDANQTSQIVETGAGETKMNAPVDGERNFRSDANREDGMQYIETNANPVHSLEKIANPESSTSQKEVLSDHDQAEVPRQDTEDYFAALGDMDDEYFRQVKIPSSGSGAMKTTNTIDHKRLAKSKPIGDKEDYLAAFGDFTEDDFKGIVLPSGTGKKLNEHSGLFGNPRGTMHTAAARPSAFQQCSLNDNAEDEYPLDEEEQAELEQLQTHKLQSIMETREPPSSILRSEEDMRDMEIYDKTLSYSPVDSNQPQTSALTRKLEGYQAELDQPLTDVEDWEFLRRTRDPQLSETAATLAAYRTFADGQSSGAPPTQPLIDEDYMPLPPFARPPFPAHSVPARSPVTGISSHVVLRTCFRIGEALSQASLCTRDNQDAVTELFARVTFSAREADGKKQNFQFGDIFHTKPPFVSGVLEKYGISDLQKTESFELITVDKEKREGELGEMVRVLGRVKRVIQGRGYTVDIVNIRKTDWEEVEWTKRVLGG